MRYAVFQRVVAFITAAISSHDLGTNFAIHVRPRRRMTRLRPEIDS